MNGKTDTTAPFDDLVSVQEAAALLHVSESTIWRWINDDVVPSYRVGRKRVYLKRAELTPVRRLGRARAVGLSEADRKRLNAFPMSSPKPGVDPVASARALHKRYLAEHGGRYMPDSSEEIADAREERSRELG